MAVQELATFLHRIALAQMVPEAIAADDPQRVVIAAFAAELGAEEIQLLYQIALQGRQDIGLAPDDYAGFTMTLMRMLAFMPEGGTAQLERPAAAASIPAARAVPPADSKKKPGDVDWNALVSRLPLAGMERMLAHNCELVAWHDGAIEPRVPHAPRHLAGRACPTRT